MATFQYEPEAEIDVGVHGMMYKAWDQGHFVYLGVWEFLMENELEGAFPLAQLMRWS